MADSGSAFLLPPTFSIPVEQQISMGSVLTHFPLIFFDAGGVVGAGGPKRLEKNCNRPKLWFFQQFSRYDIIKKNPVKFQGQERPFVRCEPEILLGSFL